jgi:peptidoglycan hydrolase-like protein with peptidoglycan-binding domain
VAASRIESPAEAAARTAPPKPSPILVPVEERVLSSDIVTRGTARFGLPQSISIAPSALKVGAGLIATLPVRNTQFKEGDVMLSASGRPVFVLQGKIPTYRDLVPGISGDDVLQLEQAVKRLGFDPGPLDGSFDEQTSRAVTEWYKSTGWEPFGPTPDLLARIRTLEQDVADATKTKVVATAAAAAAPLALETARAKLQHAKRAGAADIAAKIADRALVVVNPQSTRTARAAADAQLELARALAFNSQLDSEMAFTAAIDAQKITELESKHAGEKAARLTAELDLAKRKVGVQVPADEVVFISTLPVRVHEVAALIGSPASGTVMSVTDHQLAIDSSLPLDAAPLVKPGMPVAVDEPSLGIKSTGVVVQVADSPGTRGADGYHRYFEVRVGQTATPIDGFSLRLTIPIKSTNGAVTTVPLSALSLAADGTSRVQVENKGALEYIVVEPGLSADGFVEVTPIKGTLRPGQLVVVSSENQNNTDRQ